MKVKFSFKVYGVLLLNIPITCIHVLNLGDIPFPLRAVLCHVVAITTRRQFFSSL
jgi:hypothetical protein